MHVYLSKGMHILLKKQNQYTQDQPFKNKKFERKLN